VSLAILGAAVGSLIGGPFSDYYGRKPTIILADVLFTIGAIVMGTAPSIAILIVGRIIVGVNQLKISSKLLTYIYVIVRNRNGSNGSASLHFGGSPN
jgi:MFS family permease